MNAMKIGRNAKYCVVSETINGFVDVAFFGSKRNALREHSSINRGAVLQCGSLAAAYDSNVVTAEMHLTADFVIDGVFAEEVRDAL